MIYERRIWDTAMDAAWASLGRGDGGIGAVVTNIRGDILAANGNRTDHGERRELAGSPIAHAELQALQTIRGTEAAGGTLWCTLQPCMMCFGASQWAEVGHIRYLVPDPRWPLPYGADHDPAAAIAQPRPALERPARPESVFAAHMAFSVFAAKLPLGAYAFYERRFPKVAARARAAANTGTLANAAARGDDWHKAMQAMTITADEITEIG